MRSTLPFRRALAAALVLAAAVAACGRFRPRSAEEIAQIVFTNESIDQAAVYVVLPGTEQFRIGTVGAGRTETLTVPESYVAHGSIVIVARLLAQNYRPSSGPVSLRAGDRLVVRLPSDQRMLIVLPGG